MSEKKVCSRCHHPEDPHAVLATTEQRDGTPIGGVILCPVLSCLCYATWSVPQLGTTRADVRVPGEQELAEMRWHVQTYPDAGKSLPLTRDERLSLRGLTPEQALRAAFRATRPES